MTHIPAATKKDSETPSTTRWIGVGRSDDPDARKAGRAAVEAAVKGGDPKLLLVFCSTAYDLPALVHEIQKEGGEADLIGCSTAGEIAASGPGDASVVVLALGGTGCR